jgi:asparagine synthase (glutamine-hydrolysing)
LANPLLKGVRKPLSAVLGKMSSRYQRFGKMIDTSKAWNQRSHIFSQEQYYFSSDEIEGLVQPDFQHFGFWKNLEDFEGHTLSLKSTPRHLTSMEKQSFFDLLYYLPEDLLTKVDRASMHYSLEARVPFLDHRLIEYSLNLSPDLKFRNKTSKYILKKILYQYLPEEIFNRPKQGFSIPIAKWLQKELLPLQAGDMPETYANIDDLVEQFYYKPETTVENGINNFVAWYREYFKA